jgi:TDG/mug DNA glycosylase family protein
MDLIGWGMAKASFQAVADERTRVLVLGSLPGERSLAARQYYAHPRNQFWRLVGAVVDADLVELTYERRLERLLAARIGLWDVIRSGERTGSLDASISVYEAHPLGEFVRDLPGLKMVAFNGGKAAKIGRKQLAANPPFALIDLPSSSPAYAAASFQTKLNAWRGLGEFLA